MTALRGINLGGWLVVEKWMTPQLFEGISASDEYSFGADVPGEARDRLVRHRGEFITEEDIGAIAKAGFDIVRLPVGYWLWRKTQGYLEGPGIVDQLLGWCETAGLRVIISLHGAPGSQSGWDHTGHKGSIRWHEPANIQTTLETIEHIATVYGHHPALLGIEVLNEPHPSISIDTLVGYYRKAADIIKRLADKNVRVIVSDGFRPLEMVEALERYKLTDCVLDIHLYQIFEVADKELSFDEHIVKAEGDWHELLAKLQFRMDVMVGEWSAMLTAETFAGLSDSTRRGMVKHYYEAQRNVFDKTAWGWAYWSYKTGGPSVWNWQAHKDLSLK